MTWWLWVAVGLIVGVPAGMLVMSLIENLHLTTFREHFVLHGRTDRGHMKKGVANA